MTPVPTTLATTTGVVAPHSRRQSELNTSDFLRLMTEQLKQQDPFAPTDNSQMVAQMAQMSSSSGIAEMNASLKGIAATLAEHSALLRSLAPAAPDATTT